MVLLDHPDPIFLLSLRQNEWILEVALDTDLSLFEELDFPVKGDGRQQLLLVNSDQVSGLLSIKYFYTEGGWVDVGEVKSLTLVSHVDAIIEGQEARNVHFIYREVVIGVVDLDLLFLFNDDFPFNDLLLVADQSYSEICHLARCPSYDVECL